MKVLGMAIWSVLVLYFFNTLHMEKSILNYSFLFIILFAGVVLIERFGRRDKNKS